MSNPFLGYVLQFEVNKRSKVTINIMKTTDISFRGEISNFFSEMSCASACIVGLIMVESNIKCTKQECR